MSPVGEYNLRLGVLKELKPKLIATYSDVSTNSHTNHHYEGTVLSDDWKCWRDYHMCVLYRTSIYN